MPRIEPVPFDDLRQQVQEHIERGRARGTSTGESITIFADGLYVALAVVEGAQRTYSRGRLDARLVELMRIRSAQLGTCGPCSIARKDPSVTEDDVACLVDPERMGLPRREVLALQMVDLMATDHDAIDEATLVELSAEFDTEEIVELLYRAGNAIGTHRFVHVLDVLDDCQPVLGYDAEAVRAAWDRAYEVAPR